MLRKLQTIVWAVIILIGLGWATPGIATAQKQQSVVTLIGKGQSLFDEQQYQESIQTLSAALLRPGIVKEEKIRVYRLLAYNYIVLQREEESDGAVRGLLVLDENFSLPETESPRFRDFFDKVRTQWVAEGKPGLQVEDKEDKPAVVIQPAKIKHQGPDTVDAEANIWLQGTIDDPNAQVSQIVLHYRSGSSGPFSSAPVKYAMRKFSAEIPAATVLPPIVDYYFEARTKDGLPAAALGDAANPLRIAVSEGGSVLESPWFWIPVGAAVVTAVVVVAVLATRPGEATVTVGVFE